MALIPCPPWLPESLFQAAKLQEAWAVHTFPHSHSMLFSADVELPLRSLNGSLSPRDRGIFPYLTHSRCFTEYS